MCCSEVSRKRIRVLMIGPGEHLVGGISSLVQVLLPRLNQCVDLSYLPTVQRRPLDQSGRVSLPNIVLAANQYVRFVRELVLFRPHIVHLHTSQGLAWYKDTFFIVLARACRVKVVLHMHGGNFTERYEKSSRLRQFYTRKVLSLANAVVEVSDERRERLMRTFQMERVYAFRNCIDAEAGLFRPASRSANGAKGLFLGVVGESKGVFDLLEASASLKTSGYPLQIWIAGPEERSGDLDRARMKWQALGLEDVCHFVGTVRGDMKARLLQEASVFVLPSYQEALPMAVLEAMAAGLAIVATPVGGIPEVVRDGHNGFLVTPGDVEDLAEKLALLASDGRMRESMGQRSREIAERELDVRPYTVRLVALYESLTASGQAPDGAGTHR